MPERQLKTTKIGSADYAKVSERLKQFRADRPDGKTEQLSIKHDDGTTEFVCYIWKDKKDLLDLMKAGVTDREVLRSSADANGHARGKVGEKDKDFEKLESIALGRALAMMGYLASGEIASFEEMENYYEDKEAERKQYVQEQIELFEAANTMDALKELWSQTSKTEPAIVAAKDKRKAELEAQAEKVDKIKVPKQDKLKLSKTTYPELNAKKETQNADK